jgi:hypothetical protein
MLLRHVDRSLIRGQECDYKEFYNYTRKQNVNDRSSGAVKCKAMPHAPLTRLCLQQRLPVE